MTRTHDEAVRLASDPATPLTVLHELAMNHPEVHPLLAENPSTYPDLLTWLSGRGNPEINAALARRAVRSAEGADGAPAPEAVASQPAQVEPEVVEPESAEVEPEPADIELPDSETHAFETATAAAAAANVPVEDLPTSAMPAIQDGSETEPEPTPEAEPEAEPKATVEPTEPTAVVQETPTVAAPIQPGNANGPTRQSILGQGNQLNYRPTQRIPQQPAQQPTPQFAPQHSTPPAVQPVYTPAPEEPEEKRRSAGLWVLLGLLALLVLAGILWAINTFGGSDEPEETPTPTAAATNPATEPEGEATNAAPTETETEPEVDTEAELAAAAGALGAAASASTCSDASADAEAFDTFASAVRDLAGDWADSSTETVTSTLGTLQDRCNPGYALAVQEAASTLADLDLGDWITPVRAAPSGASAMNAFTSPTGNIRCSLDDSSAYCTITNYNFSIPDDSNCTAGRPATLLVDGDDARFNCEGEASGGDRLAYDTSAKNGQMACTSTNSGVECWNTLTGSGFKVARATGELTPQEWGSGKE